MPAAWIGAAAAVYGAYSTDKNQKKALKGGSTADPFAGERGRYQDYLYKLMSGDVTTSQDPSYKFRFDQGLEAVNRTSAGSGLLTSGNRLAALTDYGQGMASTEYANQFQRLAQLSGANIGSPAAAAQLQYQQQGNSSAGIQSLANAAGKLLNTQGDNGQTYGQQVGSWFGNLFGSGGSTGAASSGGGNSGFTAAFGGEY